MSSTSFWKAIGCECPAPRAAEQPNLVRFGPLGLESHAEFHIHADHYGKALCTFDQAQASVARRGLSLPTFREVMEHVILPGIEGRLDWAAQQTLEFMLRDHGEWVDNAFYLKDGTLFVGTRVYGLVWSESEKRYDAHAMTVGEQPRAYAVRGLGSGLIRLCEVAEAAPALVVDLWSRPYGDLPAQVQGGAGLVLPCENTVVPVSRGNILRGNYPCEFGAVTCHHDAAVRGAKMFVQQGGASR